MPRYCDIVMKGGITSGIVYPAAVFEIARDFVFKNVGGTSAGAIAAALTAAAERRRAATGATDGFDRVGNIPAYLAADKRLYRLFAPSGETRSLYHTIVGLFGRPRFKPAFVAKWCGLVWAYPVAALIGAVPGIVSLIAVLRCPIELVLFVAALFIAVLTVLGGMTIAIAIALARDAFARLPRNCYGMVTGVDEADRSSENALCTWLAGELERTAGLDPGTVPLTFGMLWQAKRDPSEPGLAAKPPEHDVNLEMITTNVTWGRPYRFPNDTTFYYDPDEFRRFFPDHVVAWMQARPRPPKDAVEAARFKAYAPGKLPLPVPGDLPVIVATRMSLAFPILLSAVPLYGADFTMPVPAGGIPPLECCWFSDGGISSNFPVTLFDSPLPRWPTFAINLAPFHPAHPQQADESKNVSMPRDNSAGRQPTFSRFSALPGFLSAIMNAMQNWNDNTQSSLPGYRDRIVTVFLSDDEGGLNLDMPPEVLARLRERGAAAGRLIAGRFRDPSTLPAGAGAMNWENHRWLRFRSTMGALKDYLGRFSIGMNQPLSPDVPLDALVRAADGTPVHSYPLQAGDREHVAGIAAHLAADGDELATIPSFESAPKPSPELVLRPTLES